VKPYVAMLQAVFQAEDDVAAQVITEVVRHNAATELDTDEGDSVDVCEVMPFGLGLTRAEVIVVLNAAVVVLIQTRLKQCFDQARELHKTIWILEHRAEEHFDAAGYEHGDFMDLVTSIVEGESASA